MTIANLRGLGCPEQTVRDLLKLLSETYGEAFTSRVFSAPDKLHHYILVFVDGENIKGHGGLDAKLAKGDEVITNGGIAGRVDDIGENFISVEIAEGVRVKLQRAAVVAVLPKGTLNSPLEFTLYSPL